MNISFYKICCASVLSLYLLFLPLCVIMICGTLTNDDNVFYCSLPSLYFEAHCLGVDGQSYCGEKANVAKI